MSYIEESLSKGEHIYRLFPHHGVVGVYVLMHFAIGLLTAGLWLIPAILIWLSWKKTEQGVTNKRVIFKHGIISLQTDEMKLSAVESITIKQGILGRIFGFGTVIITGRGAGDVVIKWISDPVGVKRDIESADHVEAAVQTSI